MPAKKTTTKKSTVKKVCQIKKAKGYKKLILWTIKDGPSIGFYTKQGLRPSKLPEKKVGPFIAVRFEKEL